MRVRAIQSWAPVIPLADGHVDVEIAPGTLVLVTVGTVALTVMLTAGVAQRSVAVGHEGSGGRHPTSSSKEDEGEQCPRQNRV